MIIKSIRIKEGLFSRFIEFSDNANLIHSKQNSKGKTTLLRFYCILLATTSPTREKSNLSDAKLKLWFIPRKSGE